MLLGQYETYSPASQSFARLVLVSLARRLRTLHDEISVSIICLYYDEPTSKKYLPTSNNK
ncbi:MAG: hypothetical protein DVB29_05325 [Verrucomicrobia bacterium]|nr:MAG: hypothetical protein DVB29_05325 [Verrucomicrobiota bacterium]